MLKINNLITKQGAFNLKIDNLEIKDSGIILLLGPNGAGKTTFFKTVSGFLTYQGNVLYKDSQIKTMSYKQRARHIAYLPQFININSIKVKDFLIMGRFPYTGILSSYSSDDYKKVDEAVKMFCLDTFLYRDLSTLSQGELQRIYLAKVFIQDAKLLLLDEPSSVLDIGQKQKTAELIENYTNLKQNSVAIIATHEPEVFIKHCKNILMIKNGTIQIYGHKKNIYNTKNISQLFNI